MRVTGENDQQRQDKRGVAPGGRSRETFWHFCLCERDRLHFFQTFYTEQRFDSSQGFAIINFLTK